MPSITEEEKKMPKSPEDRPIPAEGLCELCLYNIPRGTIMVILPGVTLLLCGGLTLAVTHSTGDYSDWTSMTSFSILIVGALITVGGALYCTKMWFKYKPKRSSPNQRQSASRNDPVNLVAVYRIRQEGQDNPAFVPDALALSRAKDRSRHQQSSDLQTSTPSLSPQQEALKADDMMEADDRADGRSFDVISSGSDLSKAAHSAQYSRDKDNGSAGGREILSVSPKDSPSKTNDRFNDSQQIDSSEKTTETVQIAELTCESEPSAASREINDKDNLPRKENWARDDNETSFSVEDEISYRERGVESRETQFSDVI